MEWAQYTVVEADLDTLWPAPSGSGSVAPTKMANLRKILMRLGFNNHAPGRDQVLDSVYYNERNDSLRTPNRGRYLYLLNDQPFFPEVRALAPDVRLTEYYTTGFEGTLTDVVTAIEARHPAGSEWEIYDGPLTTTYLHKLWENHKLRAALLTETDPIENRAGILVRYFTRPRPAVEHCVAPGSAEDPHCNVLVVGDGAFAVTVALVEEQSELQPLSLDPLAFRSSTVAFSVSIVACTDRLRADQATFEVLVSEPGAERVIFTDVYTEGPLVEPGDHIWTWDGFDEAGDRGVLDTKLLRGRLIVRATVESAPGPASRAELLCINEASCAPWGNVTIDLAAGRRRIDVEFDVYFNDSRSLVGAINEREPWLIPAIAVTLATSPLLFWGIYELGKGKEGASDSENDARKGVAALLGTLLTIADLIALGLIFADVIMAAPALTDEEREAATGLVIAGVNEHWSRPIEIGRQSYEVVSNAIPMAELGDAFHLVLMSGTNVNAGMNHDTNMGGFPIILPYTSTQPGWDRTLVEADFRSMAAHEIGHTVLKDYEGWYYSIEHKGTTVAQAPVADGYPLRGEIDLMKIYKENRLDGSWHQGMILDSFARMVAAVEDVRGLVSVFRTRFCAAPGDVH